MVGKDRSWRIVPILLAVLSGMPSALSAAPTAIIKTGDLIFGKFARGSGSPGTVAISASGGRTSSGGVVLLTSAFSPAGFTITGNSGKSYALTLPASFTMSSDAFSLNVSNVTASIPLTGALPASGTLPFTVGGTLSVGSTQQSASYSGNLAVTVK